MKVLKNQASKYVFLLLFVGVTLVFAQSIEVKDMIGTTKTISGSKIYYSSKNPSGMQLFYRPDTQSNGIRVKIGLGTLLLEWDKISSIDFLQNNNQINVTSKTGKEEIFTYIEPSSDGLQGDMELGEFSIGFKDIKNIRILNEKSTKGSK